MNGGTIAFIMGGLIAFASGAYLAATGEQGLGITFMASGLALQALALGRLRAAKKNNEGSSDAGG